MISDDLPLAPCVPDPAIAAAIVRFAAVCQLDQFGGGDLPEPSMCFVAGGHVVLRSAWGDILTQIPLVNINSEFLN